VTKPISLNVHATCGDAGRTDLGPLGLAKSRVVRVLVGGDFCPGPQVPQREMWGEGSFGDLTAQVDFALVNLECPLGTGAGGPKSGPRLSAGDGWALLLAEAGVDAVALANNHMMDQGPEGLDATLTAASDAGLRIVGAGEDLAAAREPIVASAGGLKVAFVAMAEHESGVAGPRSPGVCPIDPGAALEAIRSAAAEADVVVVVLHGGNEGFPLPRPGLRDTARFLVDCGAHAVICNHSHVIAPVEWYAGAPIAYGLGNLYFPIEGPESPKSWYCSVAAVLEIGDDGVGLTLVPLTFDETRQGVYPLPFQAAAALAERLGALTELLADDTRLKQAWMVHVDSERRHYVSTLLGLTRLERAAFKSGLWPWWRMPHKRLPALLDTVRCESHREAVIDLLEDEVAK
jgi:poly-gamma-glutamate synthesis protein (capsule biosynthesis protein)